MLNLEYSCTRSPSVLLKQVFAIHLPPQGGLNGPPGISVPTAFLCHMRQSPLRDGVAARDTPNITKNKRGALKVPIKNQSPEVKTSGVSGAIFSYPIEGTARKTQMFAIRRGMAKGANCICRTCKWAVSSIPCGSCARGLGYVSYYMRQSPLRDGVAARDTPNITKNKRGPQKGPHKKPKPRGKNLGGVWSCYPDSNWGPHPYQGCALPTEP